MQERSTTGRIDTVSKLIAASPHTLYQAFIDPNSLVKWLPPEGMRGEVALFEPHAGGKYRLILYYEKEEKTTGKTTIDSDVSEGTFVEVVPDMKIVMEGAFESEDPDFEGVMTMTWYFEENLEGTKITVIAENVPPGISKEDHIDGLSSSLDNLEYFVEKR
ncbi:MAG: SRPBCC domain-containing protein [Alkalibacterium sp.]|nr:SRPBCC domain-containing protein [Alkalibacterium sp.]